MAQAESDLGRCRDCRFWDTTFGGEGGEVEYYSDERDPEGGLMRMTAPGQWGDCQKIIRLGDSSYSRTVEGNPEIPAFLSDGSGYYASLTTESNFGCSLWEAKTAGGSMSTDGEGR